jgi:hypothetical protein
MPDPEIEARKPTVVPGAVFEDSLGKIKVMGVIDNWVMARRKGCAPFVYHINNFLQRTKLIANIQKPASR